MAGQKKQKRRGLGGLTPEKKKLLKQLIMAKAAEDLKAKQAEEAAAKRKIIESRVPQLDIGGLSGAQLKAKVKQLYDQVCHLEEEKYDWEVKIRRQDYEVNDLTIKVNDIKGKYVKPVLKKVSKTESKLAKMAKGKKMAGFRDQLKSTGQSKFALEPEDEVKSKKPDWSQDALKKHDDEEEHAEPAEEEPAAEEAEEEEEEEEEEE